MLWPVRCLPTLDLPSDLHGGLPGERGLEHYLGPTVLAVVEVLVGIGCLVEGKFVGDDAGGLDLFFGDEVTQLTVCTASLGTGPFPSVGP